MVRRCSKCNSRVRRIGSDLFECSTCGKVDTDHRVTIHMEKQPNLTPKERFKCHYENDFIFKELVDKCTKIKEELKLQGKIKIIPYKSVLSLRYKQSLERQYMFLSVDYPKYSASTSEYRLKVRSQKFKGVKKSILRSNKAKFKPLLELLEKTEGVRIKEHGWGGYPEFIIRKADDLEKAINLAKISVLNQEFCWEILEEDLGQVFDRNSRDKTEKK